MNFFFSVSKIIYSKFWCVYYLYKFIMHFLSKNDIFLLRKKRERNTNTKITLVNKEAKITWKYKRFSISLKRNTKEKITFFSVLEAK